jgi:hypothetical protein
MTFHDLQTSIHDLDRDQVFAKLGLESRRSPMEKAVYALALVGTGVLVGVGVGVMMAPKPGSQLRDDLRLRLRRARANGQELDHHEQPLRDEVSRPS